MDGEERKVFFPLKNELEWQGKDLSMSQILNLATLISGRKSLIQGQRAEKKKK